MSQESLPWSPFHVTAIGSFRLFADRRRGRTFERIDVPDGLSFDIRGSYSVPFIGRVIRLAWPGRRRRQDDLTQMVSTGTVESEDSGKVAVSRF